MIFRLLLIFSVVAVSFAGTSITVKSAYKKELNVKIQGSGVGGCDVLLNGGDVNANDCWCLWGTINFSFCAYTKSPVGQNSSDAQVQVGVDQGRCPKVTGESLLCSDLSSLGNCYDKSYECEVDANGFCHCNTT